MTGLAETALAFCREVLGWEECRIYYRDAIQRTTGEIFTQTDLNAVMDAVRKWCRSNNLGFTISCDESGFEVAVYSPSFDKIDEEVASQSLCYALLAACVDAARKLRGLHDS